MANGYWATDGAASFGVADSLQLDAGGFTFTGPAGRFAQRHDGVWFPLFANMPAFVGARPVVNWYLNSDTPSSWNLLADTNLGSDYTNTFTTDTDAAGATVNVMQVANVAATNRGSYNQGYFGNNFGAWAANTPACGTILAGTIFASRFEFKRVSGADNLNIYQRNVGTDGPTESGNARIVPTTAYQIGSQTFEQDAAYIAFGVRVTPYSATAANTFNLSRVMLEDVTGEPGALIPSEYVAAGATPGYAWKGTAKASSRTNPTLVASALAMAPQKDPATSTDLIGGIVTDAVGTALTGLLGLRSEPQAINLCNAYGNPGDRMGWAKGSGATGHTGARAPWINGSTAAYVELASGMLINSVAGNPITLTKDGGGAGTDTVDYTGSLLGNAGVNTVDTYIIHYPGVGIFGPMKFSSVGATQAVCVGTFFGSTRAASANVRIMRTAAAGDNLLLELNDGTYHRTTQSGAVVPDNNATWNDKDGVTFTLAAAPPSVGGYAATDNGRKLYFYKDHTDFGITITGAGSPTCKVVYDRAAVVAAGLGWALPQGMVYELTAGSSSATFSFGSGSLGTASRDTIVSAYAKRVSGSGSTSLDLPAHTGGVVFTNSAYARVSARVSNAGGSVNTTGYVRINVPANTVAYAALAQTDQATAVQGSQLAILGSVIAARSITAGTTRTATKATRDWGVTTVSGTSTTRVFKTNDFSVNVDFTPAAGSVPQTQCIWSVGTTTDGYAILLAGTTWTFRKTVASANTDITVTATPVAGTTVSLSASTSSTTGMTFAVGGVAATPSASVTSPAITATSPHEVGSLNGASVAYGAIRMTPGAAKLVG